MLTRCVEHAVIEFCAGKFSMVLLKAICGYVSFALLVAVLCYGVEPQTPSPKPPGVNADAVLVRDFENQVKEYVKLDKKAQAGLPALKPTASAHKINEHRRLLAAQFSWHTAAGEARRHLFAGNHPGIQAADCDGFSGREPAGERQPSSC